MKMSAAATLNLPNWGARVKTLLPSRPVEVSTSDGSTAYYATYNSNGTLKEETFVDEDGTVTHNTYDENGNLKSSEKKNANDPDAGTPTTQPDHEYDVEHRVEGREPLLGLVRVDVGKLGREALVDDGGPVG